MCRRLNVCLCKDQLLDMVGFEKHSDSRSNLVPNQAERMNSKLLHIIQLHLRSLIVAYNSSTVRMRWVPGKNEKKKCGFIHTVRIHGTGEALTRDVPLWAYHHVCINVFSTYLFFGGKIFWVFFTSIFGLFRVLVDKKTVKREEMGRQRAAKGHQRTRTRTHLITLHHKSR